MAGGWEHITDEDGFGTPYVGRYGMGDLLENGGDVNEFCDEVYGMVWWLARQVARHTPNGYTDREPSRQEILDVIKKAQANSAEGRRRGRSGI